ncbi:hypothetical protein TNCV_763571 [Trichonephila clavipes]|nr:hypothetical protein TNCV_763571 [Trichonephila clavipes]
MASLPPLSPTSLGLEARSLQQGVSEIERIQRVIVRSMGTTNPYSAWGHKPHLIGGVRRSSYEGCDVKRWNEMGQ